MTDEMRLAYMVLTLTFTVLFGLLMLWDLRASRRKRCLRVCIIPRDVIWFFTSTSSDGGVVKLDMPFFVYKPDTQETGEKDV